MAAGLNAYQAVDAIVEIQIAGTNTYVAIPGVSSFTPSGGEAPVTDVASFDGSTSVVGAITSKTVEIAISGVSPLHQAMSQVLTAYENGSLTGFRREVAGDVILATTASGSTAAIATDGTVTFAGNAGADFSDNRYARGMDIKIGSNYYNIVSIDRSGTNPVVKVAPAPSSAVTAGVYSIERPKIRQSFTGRVSNAGNETLAQGGFLEGTISIAVSGQLGNWTRVTS